MRKVVTLLASWTEKAVARKGRNDGEPQTTQGETASVTNVLRDLER